MKAAHKALREGTAIAHERLDGLFAHFDLADANGYRRFLSAHAEALLPTEAALEEAGAGATFPDWPARRRAPMLTADLAELGAAPPTTPAVAVDRDPAAIAGTLYVVEGSRLGGRFLARQVGAGLPKRYLDPDQRPPSWPALLESFERILYDSTSFATATQAALAVFGRFEAAGRRWLAEGRS